MSNTSQSPKYQGKTLETLKTMYRGINHQIDSMKMEAAYILGILPLKPGRKIWTADEINWQDTRVDHLSEKYFKLIQESHELQNIINRINAEASGELEIFEINTLIETFLKDNFNSFEEELEFFKKNNLPRGISSLKENLLEDPDYLDEVIV